MSKIGEGLNQDENNTLKEGLNQDENTSLKFS